FQISGDQEKQDGSQYYVGLTPHWGTDPAHMAIYGMASNYKNSLFKGIYHFNLIKRFIHMHFYNLHRSILLFIGILFISSSRSISQIPSLPEVHPDSIKRFQLTIAVPLSKIWLQEMTDNSCESNLALNQRSLIMDAPDRVLQGGVT